MTSTLTGGGEEDRDDNYDDHHARRWRWELKYNTQLVNENKIKFCHKCVEIKQSYEMCGEMKVHSFFVPKLKYNN